MNMSSELEEAAHYVLAWLGMDHKGEVPILPMGDWSMDELGYRLLRLRKTLLETAEAREAESTREEDAAERTPHVKPTRPDAG